MTQFNEGDKVKVGDDPFFMAADGRHDTLRPVSGREGRVVDGPDPWGDYDIAFDEAGEDSYWLSPECLSLVEPTFNEGDRVKICDEPHYTLRGRQYPLPHEVGKDGVIGTFDYGLTDGDGDYMVIYGDEDEWQRISPACLTLAETTPEPEPEFPHFEVGDVVKVVSRATYHPFDGEKTYYHDNFSGDRPKVGDVFTVSSDREDRNVCAAGWSLGKDCIEKVEPEADVYEVGTRVIVTGDTADYGHGFTAGDEGTVSLVNEEDRDYRVDGDDGDEIWYVHHDDLELVEDDEDEYDPAWDWEAELYDAFQEALEDDDEPDMVKQPQHYLRHPSGLEVIDITRHHNFNVGNALKYILRHEHKGKPVEDLRKAIQYLEFEIEDIEAGRREVAAA